MVPNIDTPGVTVTVMCSPIHRRSLEDIEAVRRRDELVDDAMSTKGHVNNGNPSKSQKVRL